MRVSAAVGVCLVAVLCGVAAARPAKKKVKTPSGDGLAKAVFVGEVFASGSLYLYSLEGKPVTWPKEVSYFSVEPSLSGEPPAVYKARFEQVVKGTKIGALEEGKTSAIVTGDLVADFVRYKSDTSPNTRGLIVALSGFEVESVTLAGIDVSRPATAAEKTAAEKWYADWKREYRKAYNEDYDPKKDEIYGRPETLVDAKQLVTFAVKAGQSVRVSRWSTRNPAQQGALWFVLDVMIDDKVVKTIKGGITIGTLG